MRGLAPNIQLRTAKNQTCCVPVRSDTAHLHLAMETNAYYANCHCGANRLLVSSRGLQPAFSCNCSLCSKKGYLWLNLGDKGFEITRGGPDSLTTYKSAALEHRVRLPFMRDRVFSYS